jgi:hypothetical protein
VERPDAACREGDTRHTIILPRPRGSAAPKAIRGFVHTREGYPAATARRSFQGARVGSEGHRLALVASLLRTELDRFSRGVPEQCNPSTYGAVSLCSRPRQPGWP